MAGCIITIDQQHAGRTAFLKPAVIAAVDLYQLANAGATIARLLDPRRTHFPGDPESGANHQLTHGLFSQHNVMEFGQLLSGERRTKVGVIISNDAQSKFSKAMNKLPITAQNPRRRFASASSPGYAQRK
ncbi:hypothetical protein Q3H59_002048 [Pantoea sp. SORGH_AS 659]|nr:hypothetical protein [Pantoea sp. SORGH_AS_0659]